MFPLPEAQLDRFFLKARLGYPDEEDELGGRPRPAGGPPARPAPAGGRRRRPRRSWRRRSRRLRRRPRAPLDDQARARDARAGRGVDRRLGARQPRARARLARVGAPRRPRLHDARRTSSGCSRPCSATGSSSRRRFIAESRGRSKEEILVEVYRRCAELRPCRPSWRIEVDATELSFPLVPRWRPVGSAFGRLRAARRGLGSSVAGTRPYQPGDDPGLIDWKLSARLSSIRGEAEFVVREDFADEAPRAVCVADRSPVDGALPRRPALAVEAGARCEASGGGRGGLGTELGLAGYLDTAPGEAGCRRAAPAASTPSTERQGRVGVRRPSRTGSSTPSSGWPRRRRSLPPGTFVFVCSDFLAAPAPETWLRALGLRWDVVPVVVQDPVWEQSFPPSTGSSSRSPIPADRTPAAGRGCPEGRRARGARRTRRASSRSSATSAASGSTTSSSGTPPPRRSSTRSPTGPRRGSRTGGGVAVRAWRSAPAPSPSPLVVGRARPRARLVAAAPRTGSPRAASRRPPRSRPAALSFGDPLGRAARPARSTRRRSTSTASACGRASTPGASSRTRRAGRRGAAMLLSYRYDARVPRHRAACRRPHASPSAVPARRWSPTARAPAAPRITAVVEWPTYRVVSRLTSTDGGRRRREHLRSDTIAAGRRPTGSRRARSRPLLAALAAVLVARRRRCSLWLGAAAAKAPRGPELVSPLAARARSGSREHRQRLSRRSGARRSGWLGRELGTVERGDLADAAVATRLVGRDPHAGGHRRLRRPRWRRRA